MRISGIWIIGSTKNYNEIRKSLSKWRFILFVKGILKGVLFFCRIRKLQQITTDMAIDYFQRNLIKHQHLLHHAT